MRLSLTPHPDFRPAAAIAVEAAIDQPAPGVLSLRYFISGATNDVLISGEMTPGRADGLWRHTCFEAFLGGFPEGGYCEFNFAPSKQWAAYRFHGYREGIREMSETGLPRIAVRQEAAQIELRATLELIRLWPLGEKRRLGLAAVIEEKSGAKSYWALAHPPGKPDFHHSDCFTLELAGEPGG